MDVGGDRPARATEYRRRGWWPGVALLDVYERHVKERPDHIAVVDAEGTVLSHAELWTRAGELADQLGAAGVQNRRAAAIIMPNTVAWSIAFLACLRADLVPATIPVTTDDETLAYMAELLEAAVVVGPASHRDRKLGTTVEQIAAQARWTCAAVIENRRSFGVTANQVDVSGQPFSPSVAQIFFTSSTTGRPKAVVHTEDTLAAVHVGFSQRFGLHGGTPIFMPSPLGHSVGAWHGGRLSMFNGSTLVLQDRWDTERALQLVAEHRCEFTAAATPFLKDLADAVISEGGVHLPGLRTFLCGGAQVPPALLERTGQLFPDTFVTVLWGMSEGGVTTCVPGDDESKVLHTAGTGLPGLELRILDDSHSELPLGAEGELAMRGPGVFVDYHGQPDLYRSLVTDDGFFRTGDRAVLDADGYVTITGRIKDLIVRGGVNVSPVPTEDALFKHPDIHEVAVVGWPDERLGERICAIVRATRELDLEELTAWCADEGLPKRQWPEQLVMVGDFPRTAAGKIRKHELRDQILGAAGASS